MKSSYVPVGKSVDEVVKCPCGRNISFGPMGEGMIIGVHEDNMEDYLRLAPIANWDGTSVGPVIREAWKNTEDSAVVYKKVVKMEETFYVCKCRRLLWRRPGQAKVQVYKPEKCEVDVQL